jgi:hypothetical protein
MVSSMNPIKALVQRFVSLPLPARMRVTKRLLELYGSEQASLEEFWDAVEEGYGDGAREVNPFRQEREARARQQAEAAPTPGEQGVYLPLIIHHSKLLPLI